MQARHRQVIPESSHFLSPAVCKVGYPATFHVTNWVVVKPCELKNGRTYRHDPAAEPIEVLVLPPHDPRLLFAAKSGSLIDCIIEEEASQITPKSPTDSGPRQFIVKR